MKTDTDTKLVLLLFLLLVHIFGQDCREHRQNQRIEKLEQKP